ncbi:MAG TPA: hypothetical protein VGM30_19725 [Puia sp.]|jgi:hypothetical protein
MKYSFKLIPLLLIAIMAGLSSRSQSSTWNRSSHWTIYNTGGSKFYKIPTDSLNTYNNRLLNDDSMRKFLAEASELRSDKAPMWMGARVASCVIDNKIRKIDISSYGGFFFDETDKKYYSVPDAVQKEWLGYLADCIGSVPFRK